MNRNQILMLTAAALLLAYLASRRKQKAMMQKMADMPPAMPIKETDDARPEKIRVPESQMPIGTLIPDSIVENQRKPIPMANVPVGPLAQDYDVNETVVATRVMVSRGNPKRPIILEDI
jgi:hypothetical protein